MSQQTTTPPPDVLTLLLQLAEKNVVASIIVGGIVALWIIGKMDAKQEKKLNPVDEMTEEELETALQRVREKKRSSPATREIVAQMKEFLDKLEESSESPESDDTV